MTLRRAVLMILILNGLFMTAIAWRLSVAHRDAHVRALREKMAIQESAMPGEGVARP